MWLFCTTIDSLYPVWSIACIQCGPLLAQHLASTGQTVRLVATPTLLPQDSVGKGGAAFHCVNYSQWKLSSSATVQLLRRRMGNQSHFHHEIIRAKKGRQTHRALMECPDKILARIFSTYFTKIFASFLHVPCKICKVLPFVCCVGMRVSPQISCLDANQVSPTHRLPATPTATAWR